MNYFHLVKLFKERYLNTHKAPDADLAFDELRSFSGEDLRSYHLRCEIKDYIFIVPGYIYFNNLGFVFKFQQIYR